MHIGAKVRIKSTGDEEIDRYVGSTGKIIKIEPSELGRVGYEHYHVQMPDGQIVVVNDSEFEVTR